MATIHLPTRRLILAGGFAVAIATGPAVTMFAAPAGSSAPSVAECQGGETEDQITNNCVPDLVPNSPDYSGTASPDYSNTAPDGGLPEIDGIPCTGRNSGQCIGLAEEQESEGPIVEPHSSVSASP